MFNEARIQSYRTDTNIWSIPGMISNPCPGMSHGILISHSNLDPQQLLDLESKFARINIEYNNFTASAQKYYDNHLADLTAAASHNYNRILQCQT